jgi:two-component system cell cycle sensor histidine kinase/response regulator CckA
MGLQHGSERDPQQLLQSFCHAAREILGARFAMAELRASDGNHLRYFLTSGMAGEMANRLGSPPARPGALGNVLAERRSWRLRNPGGDPVTFGLPATYPPVHSWLAAPILSPARVHGWLDLVDKVGAEEFTEEDERLAGILAAQIGRIYEHVGLYQDVVRHAADLDLEIGVRQRTEEELRAGQLRTRLILDNANDALVGMDAAGRINDWNHKAEALLGWSRAEAIGRPLAQTIIPARYREAHERGLQQFLASGKGPILNQLIEITAVHREGHEFLVELTVLPIVVDGTITFSAFLRDISERKRAEASLHEANENLRALIEAPPLAIFVLDQQRLVKTWNSAAEKLFGWPKEEVLGRPLPIVPDDKQEEFQKLLEEARAGRGTTGLATQRLKRDSSRLDVSLYTAPLYDDNGAFNGSLTLIADISGQKRLEEQFRQAQKMEAVGRLAGGIAHDFNNLLTVIIGYSDVVLARVHAPDPLHAFIDQIKKAGARAASLTRQLLAFSRKQMLVPEVLDLNLVLADMGKMLGRLIGEDVSLKVSPDPALRKVKVDRGQMEQVIVNLAVNARDAMPQGGKLTIETRNVALDERAAAANPETPAGRYVLLAVSDTGCGMDEATKARIFEPFFTTKGPEKGTGLGLATVYGIVKQSGGRIEVYSEVGTGTTFKIYLPFAKEETRARKSSAGRVASGRGTETVLLAEDEEGVRTLAKLVLERNGYKVLEARHGAEALMICQQYQGPIHIMVTDVVMPNMSGRQLADRLSALRPGIRLLFLSGYTDEAIVHHGVLDGDTPFLQKPFVPDALALKVREVLDQPN